MNGIPAHLTTSAPKTFTPPASMRGPNPTAPSGAQGVSATADATTLSPQAQALADAQATTARRDASLARLAEGPVVVNGQEISQKDGYKAVSDASWDRFQSAFGNLPDSAKEGIQDQLTVVRSEWVKKNGAERYNSAAPETQQELDWMWQAQAAGNYGRSSGAQGGAADLTNLADGARQYVDARLGYLSHGGTPGQ